jgi:bloom syndrome protein
MPLVDFNMADPIQISKLIEKDETPRNERQRQLDALKEVERFCWNDTDCRRKQILHHFDQDFNPQECRKLCDVCAKGEVLVEEDVTQPALDILHLTRDLSSGGEYVTKTNVLLVYRGSRKKDITSKGYDRNKLFGAGKGMSNDKVDRLFGHLLCEKGLAYQNVRTAGDWSSQYLMVRLLRIPSRLPS